MEPSGLSSSCRDCACRRYRSVAIAGGLSNATLGAPLRTAEWRLRSAGGRKHLQVVSVDDCGMAPAAHLWQAGLLPANGQVCYAVVVPVGGPALTAFYASAQSALSALGFAVPPPLYRHVTLCPVSAKPFDIDPTQLSARAARMLEIEATPYSFRVIPNQALFGEIAERLGLPPSPRPFGMTLAYATRANDASTIALIKSGLQRALPVDAKSVFIVESAQQWRLPTPRAFGREVIPMESAGAP